ncbi:hypothetical protein ACQKEY_24580 [Lysinibacillus fusiformis]|uniref:hypothetical protein n=1 Tax=Lysinibacillus fusiformis TaxID=28031 RepID=UPI003D086352
MAETITVTGMDGLKGFTQSVPFILSFLVLVLLTNMFVGQKFTNQFLYLVLFSMVILNADKMKSFVGGITK